MARRRAIDLDRNLPLRARALQEAALSDVFGGCDAAGKNCQPGWRNCCKECIWVPVSPWLSQRQCS